MLIKLNMACWITASRLVLLPVAVLPLALGWSHGLLIAASICSLAGATDAVDGYVARRLGCVTAVGAWLDLLSDKLFVSVMIGLLAWLGVVPFWVPGIVIFREVTVSLVRLIQFRGRPPASDVWGKAKMAASMVAIVGLLLRLDMQQGGLLARASTHVALSPLLNLAPWAMYLAVGLTVLSGLNYLLSYGGRARMGWQKLSTGLECQQASSAPTT
ncbi:MAG: CDP-alcohol phosphatidyltransferase family protein [Dehalococcoidia bacterium]|nr:CDP-alcohol phosphatidyltransferase family protein [Dehalococcoidia bacterium]